MAATYQVLVKNGNQLCQAVVDLTAALANLAGKIPAEELAESSLAEQYPELSAASDAVKVWKAGVE